MSPEHDFEKNMKQLLKLLKEMMMQYPHLGKVEDLTKTMKESNAKNTSPDINIFFLNLAPLTPEEFDELEEMFEETLMQESTRGGELRYELSPDDREFLKKHGIRF
jgi:hypothetical protein